MMQCNNVKLGHAWLAFAQLQFRYSKIRLILARL